MQICDADVRLGGNILQVVPKQGLTVAEICVLREIHGNDAVVNIRPTKMDKRNHAEEFARLQHIYGGASRIAPEEDGPRKVNIAAMFPGAVKKLPVTLEEAGISPTGETLEAADDVAEAA